MSEGEAKSLNKSSQVYIAKETLGDSITSYNFPCVYCFLNLGTAQIMQLSPHSFSFVLISVRLFSIYFAILLPPLPPERISYQHTSEDRLRI